MQYEELKAQVEAVPAAQAKDYRELLALASIAGGVWPRLKGHLEEAEDCRGFFQAIYDDDACRFENAWAYWAKMNKEPWADRFEAEKAVRGVRLENKGIFIEGNGNELLVPLQGRGHAANVYLFAENSFNEHAAEFYGAINGSFTCVGMELEGAFDIYRAHRALIITRFHVRKIPPHLRRAQEGQQGKLHVPPRVAQRDRAHRAVKDRREIYTRAVQQPRAEGQTLVRIVVARNEQAGDALRLQTGQKTVQHGHRAVVHVPGNQYRVRAVLLHQL